MIVILNNIDPVRVVPAAREALRSYRRRALRYIAATP
jgi:hypothetical protein